VLNPATQDLWTAPRMYEWISNNVPEFQERTMLVRSATSAFDVFPSNVVSVCEPFTREEWNAAVKLVLGRQGTQRQELETCQTARAVSD